MSPRIPLPTRVVAEGENDFKRRQLQLVILETSQVDTQDGAAIQAVVQSLKLASKDYQDANKTFYSWLKHHGHVEEARKVRSERHHLIYDETNDIIDDLNKMLQKCDLDTVSLMGAKSEISVEFAERTILNDEFPALLNPASGAVKKLQPSGTHVMLNRPIMETGTYGTGVASTSVERPLRYQEPVITNTYINRNIEHPVSTGFHAGNLGNMYHYGDPITSQQVSNPREIPLNIIDSSTRHLMKQELLKGLSWKFTGDPEHFISWKLNLERRIGECGADSLDAIHIISANTAGRPRDMVVRYLSAGISNPDATLRDVWQTLQYRFATPEIISDTLVSKIANIKVGLDVSKMEDLLDNCRIILNSMASCPQLAIFNLQHGMKMIWEKLPDHFQFKWRSRYMTHEEATGNTPDFTLFVEFFERYVREMSHPSFSNSTRLSSVKSLRSLATDQSENYVARPFCAFHKKAGHHLKSCRNFIKLSYDERKQFAATHKLCFICLGNHMASKCPNKAKEKCEKCSRGHTTAMHSEWKPNLSQRINSKTQSEVSDIVVTNSCTRLCNSNSSNLICSKTLLVDVSVGGQERTLRCLCLLDEQSNGSFCDPIIMSYFGLGHYKAEYTLSTMTTHKKFSGAVIENLMIKGVNCSTWFKIPKLYTHPNLPNTKSQVATSSIVSAHPHIASFAEKFPNVNESAQVLIMVGANCGELMRTRSYGKHHPYVHRTPLGYALVGPACVTENESGSESSFRALRTFIEESPVEPVSSRMLFPPKSVIKEIDLDPFLTKGDDELPGFSRDDERFNKIMKEKVTINSKGNIQLPLPIKFEATIPNNRMPVYYRTKNTLERLKRDPGRLKLCLGVMGDYIRAGHVEQLTNETSPNTEGCSYIPIFPVFDEFKGKVRLVFDSSAKFGGCSLNDALLQGPDCNNSLLGVLLRFRLGEVAVNADIEKMFHAFHVDPKNTDIMRFFWFNNNEPSGDLVEYRALVHVFGNKPSPAIANFGLKYTTLHIDAGSHPDIEKFIMYHFYVDDALYSTDHLVDAIGVLKGVCQTLDKFNIRLHKIRSSHREVIDSFSASECAPVSDPISIASQNDCKTLGVAWHPEDDLLTLSPRVQEREFTKRGILGVINSIFDPIGFASPVVLGGRLLQRKIMPSKKDLGEELKKIGWDDPLPQKFHVAWINFLKSLREVCSLEVQRCYKPSGFGTSTHGELHCFADASDDAIGYVIYLRQVNADGQVAVGFVYANSKVAPRAATTIPRLELCAAMEAAKAANRVAMELGIEIIGRYYYTDSRVVLGYLTNSETRFSRYVSRRIDETLKYSSVGEWSHIAGKNNVGDLASRPQTTSSLIGSNWITGPRFLYEGCSSIDRGAIECSSASDLPEFKCSQTNSVEITNKKQNEVIRHICSLTNKFIKARSILAYVLKFFHLCRGCSLNGDCDVCNRNLDNVTGYFVKEAQSVFEKKMTVLKVSALPLGDSLSSLSPFIDSGGILRVGGRLKFSQFPGDVKHPMLLPADDPISLMILEECHSQVSHQGQHLTIGRLRQSGYHILKCSSVVKKYISQCIVCRRLRGQFQEQVMSDLPPDRLEEVPPFTNVGLDLFGPYLVHEGKSTRSSKATKKVWGLLLTCLVSRAIHIELLPSLDTPSLQLGLRRFYALRGTCKRIRSDQGTNIVGARTQLLDMQKIEEDARTHGITWELIPPGASSWGGVWERKVGAIKKVLDATLLRSGKTTLSRDELNTLLQEAASVVNNTPLWVSSTHPDDPAPLSPANLLTLRDNPNPPPLGKFSERDLLSYGIKRWHRIMHLGEEFWVRWRLHHLSELQKRNKWRRTNSSIKVGDIVLIKGESKRNSWPMAKIVDIKCSRDGLPRALTLRVPGRTGDVGRLLERCVRDTVLLVAAE